MALLGALCVSLNADGFTSRSLIERIEGTNTYLPTAAGQRVAIFYTKIHNRLLRPLTAANTPPAPTELRTIDRHIHSYIDNARLGNAA